MTYPLETKKMCIEPEYDKLSIRKQCALLDLNRSSWYYQPAEADPYNLLLMRELDEQYTKTPFYGVRRMTIHLRNLAHLRSFAIAKSLIFTFFSKGS